MALTTRYGNQFRPVPNRQNWPQAEIATRMRQIWRREVGRPLRIVAGDGTNWVAGLIALSNGDIAHVFTSADYKRSPWITPEQVARDGALVVWPEEGAGGAPVDLVSIIGGRAPRYETFALRHPGKVRDVILGYAVRGCGRIGSIRRQMTTVRAEEPDKASAYSLLRSTGASIAALLADNHPLKTIRQIRPPASSLT